MSQQAASRFQKQSRVLLLSMRNLKLHVSRSGFYEFEDIIGNSDAVDIISPAFHPALFKVTNKLANCAAQAFNNGKFIQSLNYSFQVEKEYELFFIVCQSIEDILILNSIKGWREKCRYAVCWLDEIWSKDVENRVVQLQLLKEFDYIFMNFDSSRNQVAEIVQKPCHVISYGVDAVKFCPYPRDLYRCIDVLNIGKRSAVTHHALLELVKQDEFFYIYDSIKDLYMSDYRYHRQVYTNFVKRSRYTIVDKAKFDFTGKAHSQEEVSLQFFEGAASGTIMLGVSPKCAAFTTNFDWEDAVIEMPFDCPNIGNMLAELNAQPLRQEKIRKENIINSLLKHDWVYRWEEILTTLGLDVTPKILERKAALRNLAGIVTASTSNSEKAEFINQRWESPFVLEMG